MGRGTRGSDGERGPVRDRRGGERAHPLSAFGPGAPERGTELLRGDRRPPRAPRPRPAPPAPPRPRGGGLLGGLLGLSPGGPGAKRRGNAPLGGPALPASFTCESPRRGVVEPTAGPLLWLGGPARSARPLGPPARRQGTGPPAAFEGAPDRGALRLRRAPRLPPERTGVQDAGPTAPERGCGHRRSRSGRRSLCCPWKVGQASWDPTGSAHRPRAFWYQLRNRSAHGSPRLKVLPPAPGSPTRHRRSNPRSTRSDGTDSTASCPSRGILPLVPVRRNVLVLSWRTEHQSGSRTWPVLGRPTYVEEAETRRTFVALHEVVPCGDRQGCLHALPRGPPPFRRWPARSRPPFPVLSGRTPHAPGLPA